MEDFHWHADCHKHSMECQRLEMFRYLIIYFALVAGAANAAETLVADSILARYIQLALTQNPVIAAADLSEKAAKERIPQAGSLPDPMLGFGMKELSADDPFLGSSEMTGRYAMIEQMFPFPGTLGKMKQAARSEHDMKLANARGRRLMLAAEVSELYYQWAFVRAATELTERNKALMEQMAELTAQMYSVGMGAQSDLLQAQTQVTKFDIELSELRRRERMLVADINICCALPPDAITTPPLPLAYIRREVNDDFLWTRIMDANPELHMADAEMRMTEAETQAARKMQYPEFRVGAEFMRRGKTMPDNMISLSAGMTLPVFRGSKQLPMIRERRALHEQAVAKREDVINRLRLELTDLSVMLRSLSEQIEYDRAAIIPQAEQTLDAARAGYSHGRVDFMTVLNSQMTLFMAEHDHLMRISHYNSAWMKLLALTDQPIGQ